MGIKERLMTSNTYLHIAFENLKTHILLHALFDKRQNFNYISYMYKLGIPQFHNQENIEHSKFIDFLLLYLTTL
jgi:hypothetical protein